MFFLVLSHEITLKCERKRCFLGFPSSSLVHSFLPFLPITYLKKIVLLYSKVPFKFHTTQQQKNIILVTQTKKTHRIIHSHSKQKSYDKYELDSIYNLYCFNFALFGWPVCIHFAIFMIKRRKKKLYSFLHFTRR